MNKKGFTLIELLAIIVILAIIAVVTVPIILGIIDEAKQKSALNSIIGYGKSVEFSYSKLGVVSEVELESCSATDGSCVTIGSGQDAKYLKVDFSGDQVVCTTASVSADGKLTMTGCKIGGNNTPTYSYNNGVAAREQANNG